MTTTFTCNLDAPGSELEHVWSHTIGSGRALLALRADWQAQMRKTRAELGVRHVRFHGLLNDEMCTYLIECDKDVYSFFNADRIFDFLVSIGMKPFVELSFMPTALQTGGDIVFFYKANVTPPRDYAKWADLITRLVKHWVDRYGIDEVRSWYFEVWNEPNLDAFWKGSQADYFKLYRYTANAIKGVDAQLRVGGPATADDAWVPEFLGFCESNKLPADFVSTHHYPTDALGKPGDDTETQLSDAPRDVLIQRVRKMREAVGERTLCYTEWCSSSNPFFDLHDQPYAAAFLFKNMLDVADLVHCYSWWTFSDIFEENYFSSVPFHGSFGLQTIHGIAKPTYRAMQLLHGLGDERLPVQGTHPTVDAWAVRSDDSHVDLLLGNHAFPRQAIATEAVAWRVHTSRKPESARVQRVDDGHCNSRAAWVDMGSPGYLDAKQVSELDAASQLTAEPIAIDAHDDGFDIQITLPPHGIAAVRVELTR
ncbi:MAG: Xylan 1,4-beta-xylosidase [Rhodanobacteraceae bacterium]|jgi:xylan 1,4-beta-xylosidase|nr:MAG: Xylan 1,4-beta-xylosidase [Rhodanobacteraceae bacterium]